MAQYFTAEGLKKLKEELEHLRKVEIKRVTQLIAEAASFGDLKENAAYHEARNTKSFLLGRIEQLEGAINEAVIVEKKEGDAVGIGSTVVMVLDGKDQTFEMVAPGEANILKNKLSYQSPLGKQLMGRKAGDEFNYEINGKKLKVKILKVS